MATTAEIGRGDQSRLSANGDIEETRKKPTLTRVHHLGEGRPVPGALKEELRREREKSGEKMNAKN